MKAVVLVGGEGTRLRPLTRTIPKQLLPVVEVTMLERVLSHLAAHGIDGVVLSMGYQPDPFMATFPDDRGAGLPLHYAVEPTPLDTGGAIRFAALHGGVDETFLAVNGDVLTDLNVAELVAFHRDRGAEATIHSIPVDDPSRFGVVPIDQEGRVEAFIEKPAPGSAPTNLINAGTYVLEPSVLERIPPERRVSMERDVFPALVQDRALYAMASDCYWLDTGTPAAYLQAQRDLLSGVRGLPPAPGAKEASDGVWQLGEPVVDGEVSPRSLVGDAAFVGKGSLVKGAVVGSGARVEGATLIDAVVLPGAVLRPGAHVEGSLVGRGAIVGEKAEVTDLSVIGERHEVGAGERLSGVRAP